MKMLIMYPFMFLFFFTSSCFSQATSSELPMLMHIGHEPSRALPKPFPHPGRKGSTAQKRTTSKITKKNPFNEDQMIQYLQTETNVSSSPFHSRNLNVFLPDQRKPVDVYTFPAKVIGLLTFESSTNGETYFCTAALIGSCYTLVTAAHCAILDQTWWSTALFRPGFSGKASFGQAFMKYAETFGGIYPNKIGYDIAMIVIQPDSRYSFPSTYLNPVPYQINFDQTVTIDIIAYYEDTYPYPRTQKNCQTFGSDLPYVNHDCDTTMGSSGAPLYDPTTLNVYLIDIAEHTMNSSIVYYSQFSEDYSNIASNLFGLSGVLSSFNGYYPAFKIGTSKCDSSFVTLFQVSTIELIFENFEASTLCINYGFQYGWIATSDLINTNIIACFQNALFSSYKNRKRVMPSAQQAYQWAVSHGYCSGFITSNSAQRISKKMYSFNIFVVPAGSSCFVDYVSVNVLKSMNKDLNFAVHQLAASYGYETGRYISTNKQKTATIVFLGENICNSKGGSHKGKNHHHRAKRLRRHLSPLY